MLVEVVVAGHAVGSSACARSASGTADEIRLGVKHVRVAPVAIDGGRFVASRDSDQLERVTRSRSGRPPPWRCASAFAWPVAPGVNFTRIWPATKRCGVGRLHRQVRGARERREHSDKRFDHAHTLSSIRRGGAGRQAMRVYTCEGPRRQRRGRHRPLWGRRRYQEQIRWTRGSGCDPSIATKHVRINDLRSAGGGNAPEGRSDGGALYTRIDQARSKA